MPSRKEIQWSELRVGALALIAVAVLIGLIFLMSRSAGGLFAGKVDLRAFFANAAGIEAGAPVTLQGVTIGNVKRIRVTPSHNPTPVEVIMEVGSNSLPDLHTDSRATIAQAGVLGNSYVDIDSTQATGPQPANNAVLPSSISPTVQELIGSSQVSIKDLQDLLERLNTLTATLNSNRGIVGQLINDPQLAKKIVAMTNNLEATTNDLRSGKGTLGKLMTDDTLYTQANETISKLNDITTQLDAGNGTMGKLLHDDTLYNNLNATAAKANQLLTQINSGQGALGKFAKDPAFAKKLDDTVTHLNELLGSINEGQGTLGQLVKNRTLYDNTNTTLVDAQQLLQAVRQDPKKYLVIRLKLF